MTNQQGGKSNYAAQTLTDVIRQYIRDNDAATVHCTVPNSKVAATFYFQKRVTAGHEWIFISGRASMMGNLWAKYQTAERRFAKDTNADWDAALKHLIRAGFTISVKRGIDDGNRN